jgi:hypothetical protein
MLTLQRPLVRSIIQDSFDHMRAYLVFTNAFPDVQVARTFASDSLFAGAEAYRPASDHIRQRFRDDREYLEKFIPLVCFFLSFISRYLLMPLAAACTDLPFPWRS